MTFDATGFTSKERDAETGLDCFGARYISAAQGRFTSPDPKGFHAGTIANPQKWNKYPYVVNNPLGLVDPDGMEEVSVTIRAFIPFKSVTVAGRTFAGDNRSLNTRPDASFRVSTTVVMETDSRVRSNPIVSVQRETGVTHRLENGKIVQTGKGPLTSQVTGSRDANGNPVLSFSENAKNPIAPGPQALTPGIRQDLTIGIQQNTAGQATSVSVSGSTSQFPASEVNVTTPGGTTTQVFGYAPPENPLLLFLNRPVPPQTTPLPPRTPCSGGSNCPQ